MGRTGGRLVKHARSSWLFLAESYLTRRIFGSIARRIVLLPIPDLRQSRHLSDCRTKIEGSRPDQFRLD